ncbi:colony stimulating factor 3 (granulocyte) a isoform X1 [Misgurnus anguillicaudatus]|uniref:colony stimulating factor 3 (granulocyte) a isoform X1 n=2 Tax=Misgurnus anguillicaudatus TaxID=75329 RepID=UPI0024354113|nr:colony stimulating factor 3 (granulocyte) a isoform X1 [Misgurnus anguillicaudatus]
MKFYLVALLAILLGTVGSAPLPDTQNIMDKETLEQAHSVISKILEDIPKAHASWINNSNLNLGSSDKELQHLKEEFVPPAPVLESISESFTLETCLDHIFEGLKLHLNLLTEILKANKLKKIQQVAELQAGIEDLLIVINKLQNEAGFERSLNLLNDQIQTSVQDLAKKLTSEFKAEVAAHLTLQQLQKFSGDVLQSILALF